MGVNETDNPRISGGPSGAARILADPSLRKEFIAIAAQYREVIEHRDGLQQLYKGCDAWRRRQKDLDRNVFKSFMVQSFAKVFREELAKIEHTLGEIKAKIIALGVVIPPGPDGEQKGVGSSQLH